MDGLYSFYAQVPHKDLTSIFPKEQQPSVPGAEIILCVNNDYKVSWDYEAYAGSNGGPGHLNFPHVNGLLKLKKNDIVHIYLQGEFTGGSFMTLNVFFQGHLIHPL